MSNKEILNLPIEEELKQSGVCALNTNGDSMRPLLFPGCAVNIKVPDRRLRKYDVIIYKNQLELGKYILHRIIGFKGDVLVIRGDNTYRKEYVPVSCVLGYMISYIKKDKVRDVNGFTYKLYSRFWHFIYPLRKLLRKIRSKIKKAR